MKHVFVFLCCLQLLKHYSAQFTGFGSPSSFGSTPVRQPSSGSTSSNPSSSSTPSNGFGSMFGPSSMGGLGNMGSMFPSAPLSNAAALNPLFSGGTGVLSSNSGNSVKTGGATSINAGTAQGTQSDTSFNPDGSQTTNTRAQPMRFSFGGSALPSQSGGSAGSSNFPQMFGSFNFGGNQFGSAGNPAPASSPSQPSPSSGTQDRAAPPPVSSVNPSPSSFGSGGMSPFGGSSAAFGGTGNPGMFGGNMFGGNFGGFGGSNGGSVPAPPANPGPSNPSPTSSVSQGQTPSPPPPPPPSGQSGSSRSAAPASSDYYDDVESAPTTKHRIRRTRTTSPAPVANIRQ